MNSSEKTKARNLFVYGSKLITTLLDKDDIVSLYRAKKILRSNKFIHNTLTKNLSENSAAGLLYVAINMGTIYYQYAVSSWFMYFTTTISGAKKLFSSIFKNPLIGIFFFASFYFRMLEGADAEKLDGLLNHLNLPDSASVTESKFVTALVQNVPEADNINYRLIAKKVMLAVPAQITGSVPNMTNALINSGNSVELKKLPNPAIHISNRDIFDQADMEEYVDFVNSNISLIRRDIKRRVKKDVMRNRKNNKLRKKKKLKIKDKRRIEKLLTRQIEKRDSKDNVLCLDDCEKRVKTHLGYYCEGECGRTFAIGGKPWCYVDPKKYKYNHGKNTRMFMGKRYDYCDVDQKAVSKCYTGTRWKDCVSEDR